MEFETPDDSGRADWIMKHIRLHAKDTGTDLPEDPLSSMNVDDAKGKKKKKKEEDGQEKGPSVYWTRLCKLCKLWNIVDYFIKDYSQQILRQTKRIHLPLVNGTGRIGVLDDKAIYKYGLSRVEYDRMQRAFLYFELYRRLYGGQEPYITFEESNEDIGCANMEQDEFGRMLYWHENTELSLVYEYLARRMAQVFVIVEAYASRRMAHVFVTVEKYTNRRMDIVEEESLCHNDRGSAARLSDDGDDVMESSMKEGRLIKRLRMLLKDGDLSRPETLAYLLEFGLPFCRRFFLMPVSRQASIIHRYRAESRQASLAHTLMLTVPDGEDYKYQRLQDPPRFRTGSVGWRVWRKQFEESLPSRDMYRGQYGLGLLGYFFWDDNRVEGLLPDVKFRGEGGGQAEPEPESESGPEWPLRLGCFLLKEMRQLGFKEYITAPYYVAPDVNPYWCDSEDEDKDEVEKKDKGKKKKKKKNDGAAAVPAEEQVPLFRVLGLAEVEDVEDDSNRGTGTGTGTGTAAKKEDDDVEHVLAEAKRKIQSPSMMMMIKDMPLDLRPGREIDREIAECDY